MNDSVRTERLTHWLIRRAARHAPGDLAERLEEEWLADLVARPSAWSRVSFAIGCCWATRVIAHQHAVSGMALASHAAGPKVAIPYLDHDSRFITRRSATLLFVVGLHIAVFCGVMTGHLKITKWVPSPLQNMILPQSRPKVSPLPMPSPTLVQARIDLVLPEFPPLNPPDDGTLVVTEPPGTATPAEPEAPSHLVTRVQGGPGSGFPNVDDFYPSDAIRLEEHGVATVRVCVDVNGRLTSEPSTVQSSGSLRLDAGALRLAKAGSGHYRPTTEDGRPVDACYAFRVRFELRN